jgi:hypothetical protein
VFFNSLQLIEEENYILRLDRSRYNVNANTLLLFFFLTGRHVAIPQAAPASL